MNYLIKRSIVGPAHKLVNVARFADEMALPSIRVTLSLFRELKGRIKIISSQIPTLVFSICFSPLFPMFCATVVC